MDAEEGSAHHETATTRSAAPELERAGGRLAYLDNLKAFLIAGIIAAHAFMGYSEFGSWTYQDIQEVTLSEVTETIFVVAAVSLGALFLMGLFFLLSGLMAQDSLARRGPRRFATERLVRFGIPFALYTLLIWPLLEWALLEPHFHRGSYWIWFTDDDPYLDNGPMWFVGVLLLFSLVLAAWRRYRPPAPAGHEPLQARWLVPVALVVGAVTFAIRIALPADSNQPLNAHIWAWPEYLAMFGLGVIAARRGWLRPVPSEISRPAGITTLVCIVLLTAMVLSTDPLGLEMEDWLGGWSIPAFLSAMLEGVIVVAAPVWVLSFAQRRLNGTGPIRRAMARGSYAAFMLQGPVIVGLEVAFRHAPLPGDLKAVLVATLGIAVSFALAYPLVTKTPLRKVL
jgi:peptidoglycan/LPS O-acetylase OafA/YrhL